MYQWFKRLFYFPLANYFRFFAQIRLNLWKPRIIVLTGSSGKTTLLHLIESQIGDRAKYSFRANSSFGIPFDILDLHRKELTIREWPLLFLSAPFGIFKKPFKQNLYIVEVDCDRPYEGKFLAGLLKPEVTLWLNVSRAHSYYFQHLVENGSFSKVEEAIAYEFGFLAEKTGKLLIANGESQLIKTQLRRARSSVSLVSEDRKWDYKVDLGKTTFDLGEYNYSFNYLLPKETAISILMTMKLVDYLEIEPDRKFTNLTLPPGRASVFEGIKNTTLVDSTYNANLGSMKAVINMFGKINADKKWVVLGDMLEQGKFEGEEHVKLVEVIKNYKFDRVILMGPRTKKFSYMSLKIALENKSIVESFLDPKEVLDYLMTSIAGGELILFKGARFLDGVIEALLKDKSESNKLARREKVWQIRRKKFGL